MPVYRVHIEPLDPLLFGDNRSARAGVDHVLLAQDPSPLTFHGALGKFLVDRSKGWPTRVLGEFQDDVLSPRSTIAELLGVCYRSAGGTLLFPRPAPLRCRLTGDDRLEVIELLRPSEPAGDVSPAPELSRLLLSEDRPREDPVKEIESGVLVDESVLEAVLRDEAPEHEAGLWLERDVVRSEARPGIAIDNSAGTVIEGALFSRPYRRYRAAPLHPSQTRPGAGFTAWLKTLSSVTATADPIGFLGGDRRRARFTFEPAGHEGADVLPNLRGRVEEAANKPGKKGFFLFLLTAAVETGVPFIVEGAAPIAAGRGRPLQVSGWDSASRLPRKILSLVQAGAVYYYTWPEGADRAALIRRLWLKPIHDLGAAAGFGRTLVGVWS